jgi:hypothetical protein
MVGLRVPKTGEADMSSWLLDRCAAFTSVT